MSVKVIKNSKSGQVVTSNTNNPEWGYVLAQSISNELTLTADGNSTFLRPTKRTALISGRVEDLKGAYSEGMELAGMKIIAKDTTEEQIGYSVRRAGSDENAPTLKQGDKDIYRKQVLVPDTADFQDSVIMHTNKEEILAFNEAKDSVDFGG